MPNYVQNKIIDKFITELGATKIDNDSHWLVEFMHNAWKCGISQKGQKLIISVQKPYSEGLTNRIASDEIWSSIVTSIQMTAFRPTDHMIKDFERRIDWDGLQNYLDTFNQETKNYDAYVANSKAIATQIALAAGSEMKQISDTRYTINPHGQWYSNGPGAILVDGPSVRIEIYGISNIEMVKEIAALLKKYKT